MKNILLKVVLLLAVVVTVGLMGCEEARKTTGGDYGVDTFQSDSDSESFFKQGTGKWINDQDANNYIVFSGNTYVVKFDANYQDGGMVSGERGTFKADGQTIKLYREEREIDNVWVRKPKTEEHAYRVTSNNAPYKFKLTTDDGSEIELTLSA